MPTPLTFDLQSLVKPDSFPHRHVFTTPPLKGMEIKYRALPADWTDCAEAEIGDALAALGFTPKTAILARIGQVTLTGAEKDAYDAAYDALTAEGKQTFESLLLAGLDAVILHCTGSWNAPQELADTLPALLDSLPALRRTFLSLILGVTPTAEMCSFF